MNSGCWVDAPCTYIRIEAGQARLLHADETARIVMPIRELEVVPG